MYMQWEGETTWKVKQYITISKPSTTATIYVHNRNQTIPFPTPYSHHIRKKTEIISIIYKLQIVINFKST